MFNVNIWRQAEKRKFPVTLGSAPVVRLDHLDCLLTNKGCGNLTLAPYSSTLTRNVIHKRALKTNLLNPAVTGICID